MLELKEKVCKIAKHKTTLQKSVTLPNTSKLPEKKPSMNFHAEMLQKKTLSNKLHQNMNIFTDNYSIV